MLPRRRTVARRRQRLCIVVAIGVSMISSGGCSTAGDPGTDPNPAASSPAAPQNPSGSPTPTVPTAPPTVPQTLRPTDPAKIPVVGRATLVRPRTFGTQYSTVAFGDIWLVGGDSVTRLDPRSRKLKAVITMPDAADGGSPQAQGAIEVNGKLWVASNAGGLAVVDPASNRVVDQPRIDLAPYALAADGDKLWLTDFENSKVVRYDPSRQEIEASLDVPSPTGLAVVGDAIVVAQHRTELAIRINAATAQVVGSYQVGAGPENVLGLADTAWVSGGDGNSVARIDRSGKATILPVGEVVLAVGASGDGEGPVWASIGPRDGCDASNSSVLRIDPATSTVTGRVDVPCAGYAVQIGDELWVVDDYNEALYVATVTE